MNLKIIFQSLTCLLLLNFAYSTDHPVPDDSDKLPEQNDDTKMISVAECEKSHSGEIPKAESKDAIKEPDTHLNESTSGSAGSEISHQETTTEKSKHIKSKSKHASKSHGSSKDKENDDDDHHKVVKIIKKTKKIYYVKKGDKKHKKKKARNH